MRIKQVILVLVTLAALMPSGMRAQGYFQYPIVPDSVTSFQGRCNYLADHFWDFCDLGKAFSSRQKMAQEMRVYLSVIANAEPARAVAGVQALMNKLAKQPKDQLFMAEVAEGQLYADTAEIWIDELYLPIARAVADNKRLGKAERARFQQQAATLGNSLAGQPLAPIPLTLADGTVTQLAPDSTEVTILFFYDPDCSDCSLARVRLDADVSLRELIAEGKARVIAVALAEPDGQWREGAARFPTAWTVGASPDADLTVDLRNGTPDIYILGRQGKVKFKHLGADQVLDVTRQLKRR